MKRRTFITHIIAGAAIFSNSVPQSVVAQERRYLTPDQAFKIVLPTSENIITENHDLTDSQLAVVEQGLRVRLSTRRQTVFRGETAGRTNGYAMIVNEIGKDQMITFIVGITPEFKIQRIALMVFRESRGWEVQDPRFTSQFCGKTCRDRLLIGGDIVGVTGATLSSRAFCRGAKKALLLCETIYRK